MKIVAFTDFHSSMTSLKKVEVKVKKHNPRYLICAGDLTWFGQALDEILEAINDIGVPVLMVHGNHEEWQPIEELCKPLKNILFLHKKTFRDGEYLFVGYGGGGFSHRQPDFEEFFEEEMKKVKKNDKVIVLTHQPPHGINMDIVWRRHVGSETFTEMIDTHQPLMWICGHIHEGNYKKDKRGKTRIINPGPDGTVMQI